MIHHNYDINMFNKINKTEKITKFYQSQEHIFIKTVTHFKDSVY